MFARLYAIPERKRKLRKAPLILQLVGFVTIYSMFVPLVLAHLWTSVYQAIYFSMAHD